MTRKDSEVVARALSAAYAVALDQFIDWESGRIDPKQRASADGVSVMRKAAANKVADALTKGHPRFNRTAFLRACGVLA